MVLWCLPEKLAYVQSGLMFSAWLVQGRRIFLAGASPTTTTPKRIPMGNNRMYLAVGDIAHGCTLEGGGGGQGAASQGHVLFSCAVKPHAVFVTLLFHH